MQIAATIRSRNSWSRIFDLYLYNNSHLEITSSIKRETLVLYIYAIVKRWMFFLLLFWMTASPVAEGPGLRGTGFSRKKKEVIGQTRKSKEERLENGWRTKYVATRENNAVLSGLVIASWAIGVTIRTTPTNS